MRALLFLVFARCTHAYFSYSHMRYKDPLYTDEIVVPDMMPSWVKQCFNETLYKGRLCTPTNPLPDGMMYVDCPGGTCTQDVIEAYHMFGVYKNMIGIIFNGHFPESGTCKLPSTFILHDIGKDTNDGYPSYIGLHEPERDVRSLVLVYKFSIMIVTILFLVIVLYMYVKVTRNAVQNQIRILRILPDAQDCTHIQNIRVITDSVYDIKDEATCPICIEPIEQGETVSKLACGHTYKPQCIRDWLQKESRCPLCNAVD